MTNFPETRESLLVRVKDPENRAAWEQFYDLYWPVIYRIALARGLQDADAQDLAQQVLASVAHSIRRWKRTSESTRFRHWLRRLTRNAIINAVTRQPQDLACGGSSVVAMLAEVAQPNEAIDDLIQSEYRREIWLRAAEQVRSVVSDETWRAFELTSLKGMGHEEAAKEFGKPIGLIYAARSRVMKRLREAVTEWEKRSDEE